MSLIEFKKCTFSPFIIRFLLVYRKNNICLTNFCATLQNSVRISDIRVILGDFNINSQDERLISLTDALQNYFQIVRKPTHIGGATLDHVYIRNDFVRLFSFTDLVKCIYFSDHDAIKSCLTLN